MKNKQEGGVKLMIKNNVTVEEVVYVTMLPEALKVRLKVKDNQKEIWQWYYVPPQTGAWNLTEYEDMLRHRLHHTV